MLTDKVRAVLMYYTATVVYNESMYTTSMCIQRVCVYNESVYTTSLCIQRVYVYNESMYTTSLCIQRVCQLNDEWGFNTCTHNSLARTNMSNAKFAMDQDGCCVCEHCIPYRRRILSTIRCITEILDAAPDPPSNLELTVFDSKHIPAISMQVYIQRFTHHHEHFEWPILTVVLIYISRIQESNEAHRLTPHNVHRIVCAAFILAYKYTCDKVYPNKLMGKIGGIHNIQEINALEVYSLKVIEWNLHITKDAFDKSSRAYGHN
jgi:hypothetical protein